jgi:hypothetical protein
VLYSSLQGQISNYNKKRLINTNDFLQWLIFSSSFPLSVFYLQYSIIIIDWRAAYCATEATIYSLQNIVFNSHLSFVKVVTTCNKVVRLEKTLFIKENLSRVRSSHWPQLFVILFVIILISIIK